jgi:hypothetical protein
VDVCTICAAIVDGPRLGEPGGVCHPACFADALPDDAAAALVAAALLTLAPMVIVWAA